MALTRKNYSFMLPLSVKKAIQNQTPLYIKNIAPNLFSFEDLEQLLNLRPFVNNTRFLLAADSYSYSWSDTPFWLTDFDSYPADLLDSIIKEHVCYLRDCSRVNKQINSICEELESISGYAADAHIYFSFKDVIKEPEYPVGFGKHKDANDNLIICTEGSMKINLWIEDSDKPVEYTLRKGDGVVIPKGVYHQIIPLEKRISVSFAISPDETVFQTRKWLSLTQSTF